MYGIYGNNSIAAADNGGFHKNSHRKSVECVYLDVAHNTYELGVEICETGKLRPFVGIYIILRKGTVCGNNPAVRFRQLLVGYKFNEIYYKKFRFRFLCIVGI